MIKAAHLLIIDPVHTRLDEGFSHNFSFAGLMEGDGKRDSVLVLLDEDSSCPVLQVLHRGIHPVPPPVNQHVADLLVIVFVADADTLVVNLLRALQTTGVS